MFLFQYYAHVLSPQMTKKEEKEEEEGEKKEQ